MRITHVRWIGGGGTLCAVAAVWLLFAIVAPAPVQAAACCQTCEANEAACYAACGETAHESGDSLQACYDSCYYWLYEWTYGCWVHCEYCSPDPDSECYSCLVTDHGASPGYAHVLYCWQTGGTGWCS